MSSFRFTEKIISWYWDHLPSLFHVFVIFSILRDTFVSVIINTDTLLLTNFIVCTTVCSLYCAVSWVLAHERYHVSLQIITVSAKIASTPYKSPPPHLLTPLPPIFCQTTDLPAVSIIFCPFQNVIKLEIYSVQELFQTGLLHLAMSTSGSSTLLWLNSSMLKDIPLYRRTNICLCIHLLRGILIAFSVWQLWIKML